MDIDFYTQYVNINFDEILIENNNKLVNSEDVYLNFKKEYFEKTSENFELFKQCNLELLEMQDDNNEVKRTGNKYIYTYKDRNVIENKKQRIKDIVVEQERLLNNFYHYITLLNANQNGFKPKQQGVQNERRSFLSKLFDKK
jgi:hypothetical protein